MAKQVIEAFNGVDVTADMLQEASQLFSGHYGVWAKDAAQMMGKFAKAGELAHLTALFSC